MCVCVRVCVCVCVCARTWVDWVWLLIHSHRSSRLSAACICVHVCVHPSNDSGPGTLNSSKHITSVTSN